MNIDNLINDNKSLFSDDIKNNEKILSEIINDSKFLVIGGAGTIGQSLVLQIAIRNPKRIDVIDLSENNLVELVRSIRSNQKLFDLNLRTFAIDFGSDEFISFYENNFDFDYILNLSALKHVRSESNIYTLTRLIKVNILNNITFLKRNKVKNFFCVSTDKASTPINMMGGSKKIMELFLTNRNYAKKTSFARFANVAFSDGSLLYGYQNRIKNNQPIACPNNIKRYFINKTESGELCLIASLLGKNKEIFFSKLSKNYLISLKDLTIKYLISIGYEPYECENENEARLKVLDLKNKKKWPCFFFKSDTTGEKTYEEFYNSKDKILLNKFKNIGIIKNNNNYDHNLLNKFENTIYSKIHNHSISKDDLIKNFKELIPDFGHREKSKYLDDIM